MSFIGFVKDMFGRALGLLMWWVIGAVFGIAGLLTIYYGLLSSTAGAGVLPGLAVGGILLFIAVLAIAYGMKKYDTTIRF